MVREEGGRTPNIALCLQGGIGDLVVIGRFWRDFVAHAGDVVFDLYHFSSVETVKCVLGSVSGCRAILDGALFGASMMKYDYALRANSMLYVDGGRLLTDDFILARTHKTPMETAIHNIIMSIQEILPIAQHHPRLDGALGQYAYFKNRCRRDFLHFMAKIPYGGDRFELSFAHGFLETQGLQPSGYITIHNGCDSSVALGPALFHTKGFERWSAVIAALRHRGVDRPIVQIGAQKTSIPISGVDVNLIGQTTVIEAMSLVQGAAFHIDIESGFVHVAASFGTRCCVLFGPTPHEYFQYPGNINIPPKACGGCWWAEPTWVTRCPRGFDKPICMAEHDTDGIAALVAQALVQDDA